MAHQWPTNGCRKYVARTVRNFTVQLEDAVYMSKEERFTSVIKVLTKSTNEDVLWNASVVVYNMLNCPSVKLAPDGSVVGGKKVEVLTKECKDTLVSHPPGTSRAILFKAACACVLLSFSLSLCVCLSAAQARSNPDDI
jgi:hypothetical protein